MDWVDDARQGGLDLGLERTEPDLDEYPGFQYIDHMAAKPMTAQACVLASALAAGLMLTVASCSHIAPIGPGASAPQPRHLRSPFVLEAVRIQPQMAAGGCPAGSVALSGGPGQCYRKLGTPVTITSAAVSSHLPAAPPGQQAGPAVHGFVITVPAADLAALTAVTTTAADAHGYLDIGVAGRTWLLPRVLRPFTSPHFEIVFPSRNQALQLQRLLVPSG